MDLAEWIGIITVFASVVGGIIALTIKGTSILNRLENRQIALEEQMDTIHETCHIPVGTMEIVQAEIKELQAKDNDIVIQLTDMNNTLTQTNSMTTAMYNHFFEKGIKEG